jgi:Na+-translocating ferredoxin:NAD+ oxidoreductase RnfG subunit
MRRRWPVVPLFPTAVIVVVGAGPAHAVQYLTVERAQRLCFAEATAFEPADVTLTRDQMRAIEKDSRVNVREATEKVWRVLKGTTLLGWFIEDEVVGKHEFITWALALNADGTVRQIEILDYRETYGHEIRDPKWREQFVGRTHGAPLKLDKDIKNISGATLSSRHIAEGVRRLLSFYELVLKR